MEADKIYKTEDISSMLDLSKQMTQRLWQTLTVFFQLKQAVPNLARNYELIYSKPEIGLEGGLIPKEKFAKGHVEFQDVTFKYPGSNDILKDVNLKVGAGQFCGITGPTGSGKSTLAVALQRFYDVRKGKILLDGMDIKDLNPMWLHRQLAVVSQRPRIFNVSVLKNLTYGCDPDPSGEEVEDACRAAQIHDLIYNNPKRFPLGVHTRVSNETLSGGELQRITIARAILRGCPVVVLDEATSSLDSESQSLVKEGLRKLLKGKTFLTVAHRLETIKESDIIICLQDGRVVEQGSHHQLVQSDGLYSRLYREQIESTMKGNPQEIEADPQDEARAKFAALVQGLCATGVPKHEAVAQAVKIMSERA